MKRKLILGVVLGLALVVWLTVGASAAFAAPTCADCHAAPPAGPPAPHGVLVAAVTDCTTCHVGMVPHPASLRTPILTLAGRSSDASYVLEGKLSRRFNVFGGSGLLGLSGVTVHLQQRLWGATDFTDLATATTGGPPDTLGVFTYTVATPAAFATYRVIAQGVTGLTAPVDGTWRPSVAVLLPKPKLTLKLAGLKDGVLAIGDSLVASGTVSPAGLTAEKVKLVVMKSRAGQWVRVKTVTREITATDTYTWSYSPAAAGAYKIQASLAATDAHRAAATAWKKFKVK